jgi:hypothetical protein
MEGMPMTTRTETTYLDEGGVLVTDARVQIAGRTHSVNTITTVSTTPLVPSKAVLVSALMLAAVFVLCSFTMGGNAPLIGLILAVVAIGAGIWHDQSQKIIYRLRIVSAAGEASAVTSEDRTFILRAASAINQAIAARK